MIRKLFSKLWADDAGFVISTEMLFVAVILVVGVISGLAALRAGVIAELSTLSNSIMALDPGYNIAPVVSTTGSSNGSIVTAAAEVPVVPTTTAAVSATTSTTLPTVSNIVP